MLPWYIPGYAPLALIPISCGTRGSNPGNRGWAAGPIFVRATDTDTRERHCNDILGSRFRGSAQRVMLPCGCLGDSAGDCLPAGTRLVLIGDSIMRYQYLDLCYTLRYGNTLHQDRHVHNPMSEISWKGSWPEFFRSTHTELQPYERTCDCYRPVGPWSAATAKNITENRIFVLDTCDIRVAYIQANGAVSGPQGHWPTTWDPESAWDWRFSPMLSSASWRSAYGAMRYFHDWQSALWHIVAAMDPTVVVLNAGHHPTAGLNFSAIRAVAASAAKRCAIWQATTAAGSGPLHEDAGARQAFASGEIFEAGRLTNQLRRFWDRRRIHFAPGTGAYHAINVGLLQELRRAGCFPPSSRPLVGQPATPPATPSPDQQPSLVLPPQTRSMKLDPALYSRRPLPHRIRILDVFQLNDEVAMMRYRLALHSRIAIRTVIVESSTTFTGDAKPLHGRDALTAEEIARYRIRLVEVTQPARSLAVLNKSLRLDPDNSRGWAEKVTA